MKGKIQRANGGTRKKGSKINHSPFGRIFSGNGNPVPPFYTVNGKPVCQALNLLYNLGVGKGIPCSTWTFKIRKTGIVRHPGKAYLKKLRQRRPFSIVKLSLVGLENFGRVIIL